MGEYGRPLLVHSVLKSLPALVDVGHARGTLPICEGTIGDYNDNIVMSCLFITYPYRKEASPSHALLQTYSKSAIHRIRPLKKES